MKKILTLALLIGAVASSFGQGQVNFLNTSGTLISTNTNPVLVPPAPATGLTQVPAVENYWYALFKAPAGTTDRNAFVFTGFYGTNTLLGRFSGGAGSGTAPALAGEPVGSTINLLIRAWSDNSFGKNWANVANWIAADNDFNMQGGFDASYGESGIATVILGGGATPIPNMFGTGAGQISGFTMAFYPVPEPSTFALAGLGAAALLIFRRRK